MLLQQVSVCVCFTSCCVRLRLKCVFAWDQVQLNVLLSCWGWLLCRNWNVWPVTQRTEAERHGECIYYCLVLYFKYIKASELEIVECISVFVLQWATCTAGLCLCQWVALTLVACTPCHSHYLSYCSCQRDPVTACLAVLERDLLEIWRNASFSDMNAGRNRRFGNTFFWKYLNIIN